MKRIPLKWHGGKSYLAPWILSNFPPRASYSHYLEPYAGGLSVLFHHNPEGKSETVNDINQTLTNFWTVLKDSPDRFLSSLSLVPLSEVAWTESAENLKSADPFVRAVAFFVRYRQSRQGLGKDYCTPTRRTRRGMNENVSSWLSSVDSLLDASERLLRVEIRNLSALEFIRAYDHAKALFYLDPPYLHSTRVSKSAYEFEMTEKDHEELLSCLDGIKGRFILSGYRNDLYDYWSKSRGYPCESISIDNKSSGKRSKPQVVESIWKNFE